MAMRFIESFNHRWRLRSLDFDRLAPSSLCQTMRRSESCSPDHGPSWPGNATPAPLCFPVWWNGSLHGFARPVASIIAVPHGRNLWLLENIGMSDLCLSLILTRLRLRCDWRIFCRATLLKKTEMSGFARLILELIEDEIWITFSLFFKKPFEDLRITLQFEGSQSDHWLLTIPDSAAKDADFRDLFFSPFEELAPFVLRLRDYFSRNHLPGCFGRPIDFFTAAQQLSEVDQGLANLVFQIVAISLSRSATSVAERGGCRRQDQITSFFIAVLLLQLIARDSIDSANFTPLRLPDLGHTHARRRIQVKDQHHANFSIA
ncbi:unnamed protein product [Caenorhabditis auriculariae]|uniref:Uncharacterized protein n=1 Tax=Caenorhabditis auriculariae TaxID=2777116 RepID=A0A8S1HVY8_9PELO|nr:unnamed protein product [Caenorhabditis auriculariae]